MKMLKWCPKDRASARELLDDAWLKVSPHDTKSHMSRNYQDEWLRANGEPGLSSSDESSSNQEEDEESENKSSQQQDDMSGGDGWESDDGGSSGEAADTFVDDDGVTNN